MDHSASERRSPPSWPIVDLTISTRRSGGLPARTLRLLIVRRWKPPSSPASNPLPKPFETWLQSSVMPIPITIPRLGWNMEEGVFVGWLKRDGDVIKPGDSLFSLESEKATEDVECLDSGTLRIPAKAPKPGDSVRVGDVIGYLLQPGETIPSEENV